jgi:arginyl-tRNA synthetase
VFSKGKVEDRNLKAEKKYLDLLVEPEEIRLIRKMVKLPELIEDISINYQVHHLAQYSYELASAFHNFYEKHRIIQEDKKIEKARILLCLSVAGILGVCLGLMGLSAPKKM